MDGGKYVGEGTYGCVFRPALPCRGEHPVSAHAVIPAVSAARADAANTLSKVFNRPESFRDESENTKLIARIDPKQRYFVYPRTACTVTTADLRTDRGYSHCELLRGTRGKAFPTLKIPYGGEPLDKVLGPSGRAPPRAFRVPDPLSAYLTALHPVAAGLVRLARAHVTHHDLKMDNILYDANLRECRIIDFGLSLNSKDALSPTGNPYLYSRYIFHPPEYRMSEFAGHSHATERALATDLSILKVSVPGLSGRRRGETLRDRLWSPAYTEWTRESYTAAFSDYAKNVYKKHDGAHGIGAGGGIARQEYMQRWANRIDIWAFGLTLLFTLHRVWPTQSTPLPAEFRAVLTAMVHPDPRKRLSPEKLLGALAPWTVGASHAIR